MENYWRPIETAPKDGTQILVRRRHYLSPVVVAFWTGHYWGTEPGAYKIREQDGPTHWMPLPPPPGEDA